VTGTLRAQTVHCFNRQYPGQHPEILCPKETQMATSKRGFASMDAAKQKEIASKGGRAAHSKGTAHEFTSDEARIAGRKGGEAVSRDRAHMAAIGREGGHSRGARARAAAAGNTAGVSSGNTDVAQSTGSQPFVREATDSNRPSSNNNLGSDRSSSRDERSGSDGGSFSSRERY
jgi:general stress protein YciG